MKGQKWPTFTPPATTQRRRYRGRVLLRRLQEAPGVNLIIARTETGEKLLNEVIASGEMEVAPFDMKEMDAMHASHLPRKLEFPGRHLGVRLAGQPITAFRGFRPWKALFRGGIMTNFKSMIGIWKRVRRGNSFEPLE